MENQNQEMGNPFPNQQNQMPEGKIEFTDESKQATPQTFQSPVDSMKISDPQPIQPSINPAQVTQPQNNNANQTPDKKSKAWVIWTIGLIVGIIVMIPVIGILASIVLVSLNTARSKASDAALKATIASQIPAAIIYFDDNNSFKGFNLQFSLNDTIKKCSGDPIMNISPDGQTVAFFTKSCAMEGKYFCGDVTSDPNYTGQVVEVDEQFAKSGASRCDKSIQSISPTTENKIVSGQIDLPNSYRDEKLGFGIKYPNDWIQIKTEDKESGIVSTVFSQNVDTPSAAIILQGIENENDVGISGAYAFVKGFKEKIVTEKGKNYDEKSIIYAFKDGTNIEGRELKSEYLDNGIATKQRMTVIPNGKKMLWFTFVANADQYDAYSNIAAAMFNSWAIDK